MPKSQWSGDCWEGEEGRGFNEMKAKLPVGRTGSMDLSRDRSRVLCGSAGHGVLCFPKVGEGTPSAEAQPFG